MEEDIVRERAKELCAALVAGDVQRATETFSKELRQNLGEVLALLPLPLTDAAIGSVERGASAFVVELRLVGESEEVVIQTRWKDRDGQATVVEASHLSRVATAAEPLEGEDGELGAPTDGSG